MAMTFFEVRAKLRKVGILVSKYGGSIRVNHFGAGPETARFTSSLEDALRVGLAMAKPHDLPENWCGRRQGERQK
jgi:hypothetical protein